MTPPMRDPSLCVELGYRAVKALMGRPDWEEQIDRLLDRPPRTPSPSVWERS